MENLSAADVAAVTRPYGYGMGMMGGYGGFGYGGDWIAILLIAALFGGFGGNGFGGGGGFQQGFNTQNILSKLDGITNGICDGFYATATNSLQAQNQLQRDLCQGFSTTNAAIAENRYAAQQCCCETQRSIDSVKYGAAQNTCEIVNAIHNEGEKTRRMMLDDKIETLQYKLADKDRDILARDFQLSQIAQNNTLINKLQPTPLPAYVVANPNCCYKNYGCGCENFA